MSATPARIELLTSANKNALDDIAPAVFDHEIDARQLAAFLEDPGHHLVIAVDDECVVGMASGSELLHPDKPPQLFINEIGVTPSHRRQGVGRALIESLLAAASDRGCTYAWLGTGIDNVAGQACFGSVPGATKSQPFLLYEWDLQQ